MKKPTSICLFWCIGGLLYFLSLNLNGQTRVNSRNSIEIEFSHFVGNELLTLDSSNYKNELNQDFTVTKFKYYIGNIVLTTKNGELYKADKYYLIDEEKEYSKNITLENIPDGEYVSMNFTVGVDSIDNCSGAQSGALDPINGMFWTWNTGYIFMKLEGISSFSTSPNAQLEYHIGGYKNPYNCNRTIFLALDKSYILSAKNKEKIRVKTDVLEVLRSPTIIDFAMLSSVTDFNNSTTIADNYTDMFSVMKYEKDK